MPILLFIMLSLVGLVPDETNQKHLHPPFTGSESVSGRTNFERAGVLLLNYMNVIIPIPFKMFPHGNRAVDLTGKVYDKLTVLGIYGRAGSRIKWVCICECGKLAAKALENFQRKVLYFHSCGCYNRIAASLTHRTHGASYRYGRKIRTPEYSAWSSMKERCYRTTSKFYNYYGGRGITVCEKWRNSFQGFLADMGKRPSKKHSLDRKDNNGNYEPSNCRLATQIEQHNNQRNNRLITHNGRTMTATQWAEEIGGIDMRTIARRMDEAGWSAEKAIYTPVRYRCDNKKRPERSI